MLPPCRSGSIWARHRPNDRQPLAIVTCRSPLTSPAQQSAATSWAPVPGSSSQAPDRNWSTTPLGLPGTYWGSDLPPQPGMRERNSNNNNNYCCCYYYNYCQWYSQKCELGKPHFLSLPTLPFLSFFPLPSTSFPFVVPFPLPIPSLPLELRAPIFQLGGMRQSPSQNQIWCIIASKFRIKWQQW